MNIEISNEIRRHIEQRLRLKGKDIEFDNQISLFASGLLDSLAMLHMIMFLEERFHVDFDIATFDPTQLDTPEQLTKFIADYLSDSAK